ncbi:MAG: InlB B-repeat-containing protein [Butyrivibrio sp.]|nr:InlB B-repeat-containing protein [Butyrivibrio sp.]
MNAKRIKIWSILLVVALIFTSVDPINLSKVIKNVEATTYSCTTGGYKYEYTPVVEDGVKYADDVVLASDTVIETDITVPEELDGYKVRSIGSDSKQFVERNMLNIKENKIILPDNLKRINKNALNGCFSLKEINLPEGLEEIGDSAFSGCRILDVYIENPSLIFRGNTKWNVFSLISYQNSTTKDFADATGERFTAFDAVSSKYNLVQQLIGETINFENADAEDVFSSYFYVAETNINSVSVNVPYAEHYDFVGYYTEENGKGTKVFDEKGELVSSLVNTGKEQTLYSYFTPKRYNITLVDNSNGEASIDFDGYYYYGDKVVLPENENGAERIGYDLVGWYDNPELIGTTIETLPAYTSGDYTFYAQWKNKNYNLKYDLDGGTCESVLPDMYTYGTKYVLPTESEMKRDGYTFVEWQNSLGEKITEIKESDYGAKKLTAIWSANHYTISYNNNMEDVNINGSIVREYYSGTNIDLHSLEKRGYEFLGWYDNERFVGEPVVAIVEEMFGDKNFYGKWKAKTYKINYNLNGGTWKSNVTPIESYTFGNAVSLQTDVTREGYTFAGWALDNETVIDEIDDDDIGDFNFTAQWTANKYKISYDEVLSDVSYIDTIFKEFTYDKAVVFHKLEKTGYEFEGWLLNGEVVNGFDAKIASDITLEAKWSAKTYKINYELNGGNALSETAKTERKYGEIVNLESPTRYGYTFDGWYEDEIYARKIDEISGDIASDVTVYAKWTPKKYTYTINTHEGYTEIESIEVTFGESIGISHLNGKVRKDGYSFVNWGLSIYGNETKVVDENSVVDTEGDGVLEAFWDEGQFEISFNTVNPEDNTVYPNKVVTYGQTYGELPTPKMAGYTFLGWAKKDNDGNYVYIRSNSIVQITENTIFNGIWKRNSDDLDITFEEGSLLDAENVIVLDSEKPVEKNITNPWFKGNPTGNYYEKLSSEGKKVYAGFYNMYANGENVNQAGTFDITSSDTKADFKETLKLAMTAFVNEHPEITWLGGGNFVVMAIDGGYRFRVSPCNWYSFDQLKMAYDVVSETDKYIELVKILKISSKDTDAQKAFKILDFLRINMKYGILDERNQCTNEYRDPAYSLFCNGGYGVCAAYAKLYKILANYCDLECEYVTGDFTESHAWNYVKLDGKWYLIDPTNETANADEKSFFPRFLGKNTKVDAGEYVEDTFNGTKFVDTLQMSSDVYVQKVTYKGNTYNIPYVGGSDVWANLSQVKNKKNINIPNIVSCGSSSYKVENIKDGAFSKATKAKKITLSSNITLVKTGTFTKCKKLKTLIVKNKKMKIKANAFKKSQKVVIKVPKILKKKYTKIFKKYKKITVI